MRSNELGGKHDPSALWCTDSPYLGACAQKCGRGNCIRRENLPLMRASRWGAELQAQCSALGTSFTPPILPSAGGRSWLLGFLLLPSSKFPGTNTDMCITQSMTKGGEKKALFLLSFNCFSPEHPLQQLSPLPRALCTPPLLPARRTLSLQMAIVCFAVTDVWSNLERGEKKSPTFPFIGSVGAIAEPIHLVCSPKLLQPMQGCSEMRAVVRWEQRIGWRLGLFLDG